MKDQFIKLLSFTKMELIAPVGGGGIGVITWAIKWAPIISIVAALTGIILGILSYRLKKKQAQLEIEYYSTKVNYYKRMNSEKD